MGLSVVPGTLSLDRNSVYARVSVGGLERDVCVDLDGSSLTVAALRQKLWEAHQSQPEFSGVDRTRYPMASRA